MTEDRKISLSKETVLVVDDSPANLELLAWMLSQKDYMVRLAKSCKQAIECLESHPPDIILLDIMMPEMDGYEFCSQLKSDEKTRHIPVIVISVLNKAIDKMKAFQVGAVDYIIKPFHLEEVVARVENQLSIRRLQKELTEQNARLQQEIRDRIRAEEALSQRAEQLRNQNIVLTQLAQNKAINQGDLTVAFEEITQATARSIEVERSSIWLYDETNTKLQCIDLFIKTLNQHFSGYELAFADYPAYFQALVENPIVVAHDAHTDSRTKEFSESYLTPLGINSMLDAPIRLGGKTVGVLCLEQVGAARHWSLEDQNFARSVADLCSLALEARERQQAEAALRYSEEKFASAFRASPDAIAIATFPDQRHIEINDNFCYLFGYSQAQVFGKTAEELEIWVDRKERERIIKSLQKEGAIHDEEVDFRTSNGQIKTVLFSAELFNINGEKCLLTTSHDITERKKAEEKLRRSQANLAEAQRVAHVGSWEFNVNTYQMIWSEEVFWIFGLNPNQPAPKYADFIQHIHSDDRETFQQRFAVAIADATPYELDVRILRPNGETRYVETRGEVFIDERGQVIRLFGSVLDITERKLAEIALQKQFDRSNLLRQITDKIRSQLDIQQIFKIAANQIGQAFNVNRAYILTYEELQNPQLTIVGEYLALGYVSLMNIEIPVIGNLHAEQLLLQDKPIASNNIYTDPLLQNMQQLCETFELKSMLAVRTSYQGKANGIMSLHQSDRFREWTDGEVEFIEAVAAQLGIAIAQAKLLAQEKKARSELDQQNLQLQQEIRERILAENALIESESKYRALVEASQDMIWSLDIEGRYTFVNPAVKQIYGYEPAEMLGKHFTEFMSSEQVAKDLAVFSNLLDGAKIFQYETTHLHKNGKLVNLMFNAIPLQDESGNFIGTTGTASDITERKQREEALKLIVEGTAASTGKNFMRSCVSHLAQMLQVRYAVIAELVDEAKTKARSLAFWNGEGWEESFEYELDNTPCETLIQERTICYYPQELQALFPKDEYLIKLSAESYLGVPLIDSSGNILGYLAVLDVKPMAEGLEKESILQIFAARAGAELERQQAEIALQISQERLQLAIEASNLGLWDWNIATQEIYCQPSWQELLGYESHEIGENIQTWRNYIHPDDLPNVITTKGYHLTGNAPIWTTEYRMRSKLGEWKWILIHGKVTEWNEAGQAVRMTGTYKDISARKKADRALQESERRFRAIFNSSFQYMGLLDTNGTLLEANQTSLAFAGVEEKDVVGLPFWQTPWWRISQQARVLVQDAVAEAASGSLVRYEVDIMGVENAIATVDFSLKPVFDETGQVVLLIAEARDISDRICLERELALREARLNAFFSCAPVGLKILDNQLRFVQINEVLAKNNGLTVQEHIGKTLSEVLPELVPILEPLYQQVLATNQPVLNLEVNGEIPTQPGMLRHWVASYFPILGNDGLSSGIGAVVVDITDRKQAEQSLRQSEATNRALLNAIPDMMFRCQVDGTFIDFKPAKNIKTLLPPQEFLGKNVVELLPPEISYQIQQAYKIAISSQEIQLLEYKISLEGEWRDYEARIVACSADEVISIVRDITDRKQAESALRESAEREKAIGKVIQRMRQTLDFEAIFHATTEELRQVLNCDRVAVYRFNPDWSGEFVSESVAKDWVCLIEAQNNDAILKTTSLESEKCPVKNFNSTSDIVVDTYLKDTQGGAYSRGASHLAVEDIYLAGFETCYINLLEKFQARAYIIVPIFCGNQLWGLLASYQNSGPRQWKSVEINMTIQIGTQLGVALQQAELLAQTQKQSVALQQAAIAADAANRAKSEFLANMSHELRTPLNAILGFTQVMSRDTALNKQQQENLSIINRAGEHLLSLINDILEMSKIEAGRTTLNVTSFDLIRLLKNLEEMLQLKAQSKDLQLKFEISSDIPEYVQTDEGKLRQVLINILGNAIKFTEKGSVILRVKLSDGKKVTRSSSTITHTPIIFEIEDTGPGIASEEIKFLFEPFAQTQTGKKSLQGTGLGLPISRKFVQLMNGDITVKSTLNEGTLFAFDIEVKLVELAAVQSTQPTRRVISLAPNQPEYRILVVDDHPESRLLLVEIFKSIGFQVKEAENGQQAFILWESWEPHLICMDMRMPVMDGYETTKQIKAYLKGQATVIIALTASAFEENRKMVLSAGCDDFVRKPLQQEVLLEKVSQHLGVKYIYQVDQPSNENAHSDENFTQENLIFYLSQMPADWVAKVYNASSQGSDDMILELIEEIPSEKVALANVLTDLATNFKFEEIMELTQEGAV
ncbi:MAG TPA: PAS domain S-box protein [Leptolyngbyaceae cyanobacterium]